MRRIDYIVLHCTATAQSATVESIRRYWREENHWKSPGYHYMISADGSIHHLLDIEQIANGVKGYNAHSIHISYIGGINTKGQAVDNRTQAQIDAQIRLIKDFKKKYPDAIIQGHRDFPGVKKACPSFDVKTWLASISLV